VIRTDGSIRVSEKIAALWRRSIANGACVGGRRLGASSQTERTAHGARTIEGEPQMNVRNRLYVLLAILLALPLFAAAPAHAAPGGCTVINYLPYTITQPGCYCFATNMSTALSSGNAITIESDNVLVDLDGYTLDNRNAGNSTAANGVYVNNRSNVVVRNGSIRGFYVGVFMSTTSSSGLGGWLAENLIVADSKRSGILFSGSYGGVVRQNAINGTQGLVAYDTIDTQAIYIFGGSNVWVIDNTVVGTTAKSGFWARSIAVENAPNTVVEHNRISNGALTSNSYGISCTGAANLLVTGNRVANVAYGICYFSSASGKYRDNLTCGTTVPVTGGTNAGDYD
jgi:hypothetical protein